MWARIAEASFALWLAASPLVFGLGADHAGVWAADVGVAVVIALCSLASRVPRLRRAPLVTLTVGLALAALGLVQARPLPAWHQNHIIVGLLLAMFAIVPTRASEPPGPWRRGPVLAGRDPESKS